MAEWVKTRISIFAVFLLTLLFYPQIAWAHDPGISIIVGFALFVFFLFIIPPFLFWVWMVVDAIRRPENGFPVPRVRTGKKIIWLLILFLSLLFSYAIPLFFAIPLLFFLFIPVSIIYYILVYKKTQQIVLPTPESESEKKVISSAPVYPKVSFEKERFILSLVLLTVGFFLFLWIANQIFMTFGLTGLPEGSLPILVGWYITNFGPVGAIVLLIGGILIRSKMGTFKTILLIPLIVVLAFSIGLVKNLGNVSKPAAEISLISKELSDAVLLKEGGPHIVWSRKVNVFKVYKEIAYLGSGTSLSAVEPKSNKALWVTKLPKPMELEINNNLNINDDVIFIKKELKNRNTRFLAVDTQTGKIKSPYWMEVTGFGQENDKLTAYDVNTGRKAWSFEPKSEERISDLNYLDGEIAFLVEIREGIGSTQTTRLLDAHSGKTITKRSYKKDYMEYINIGWIARVGDLLLVAGKITSEDEKEIVAIDSKSGEEKWKFKTKEINDVRVNANESTVEFWDGDYWEDGYFYYALDLSTGKLKLKLSSKEKPIPSNYKKDINIRSNDAIMSPPHFSYKGKRYKFPGKASANRRDAFLDVTPVYDGELLLVLKTDMKSTFGGQSSTADKLMIYCVKP